MTIFLAINVFINFTVLFFLALLECWWLIWILAMKRSNQVRILCYFLWMLLMDKLGRRQGQGRREKIEGLLNCLRKVIWNRKYRIVLGRRPLADFLGSPIVGIISEKPLWEKVVIVLLLVKCKLVYAWTTSQNNVYCTMFVKLSWKCTMHKT